MRLSINKTEFLEAGMQTDGSIAINGHTLKKSAEFKYLGSLFSADGDSLPDAQARVNTAWLKCRQVTGVFCDRKMPVVRPVVLCGSECWPATAKHRYTMHAMEMCMLQWVLSLTLLKQVRNEDVIRAMGIALIMEKMREARLRWYGHVMRSDDDLVVKTTFYLSLPREVTKRKAQKEMDGVHSGRHADPWYRP